MRSFSVLFIICILFSACNNTEKNNVARKSIILDEPNKKNELHHSRITAANKDSLLADVTKKILTEIKYFNLEAIVPYIHPTEGVRFSPYAFIDIHNDVTFTKEAFRYQVTKGLEGKIYWGNYDGIGDQIILTIEEYFKRFVYNADFLNAEKFAVNKFIQTGNTKNNLEDVYKNACFTESNFSGFDPKYKGLDWKSLRLVFKEYNNSFCLVGVVSDGWTI